MTGTEALLAALIFGAGAAVQGAVGFGANLVAAPLLVLPRRRRSCPGPVIVASGVLNVLVTWRERTRRRRPHRERRHRRPGRGRARWPARVIAAAARRRAVDRVRRCSCCSPSAVSVAGWHLAPTRPNLAGAGVASGFMGTISGIGGPPIALAYLGLDGPALRATLARYFLVGNLVAIPTLIVVGSLGVEDVPSASC